MKITKFVHSCLLIEIDDRVGLFDPGIYSWESGLFDLDSIAKIDDLVITHEHPDHMHIPFIKTVIDKFPDVQVITTPAAKEQLKREGIERVEVKGNSFVELFKANHETMAPLFEPPKNIGVHYMGKLSHPGDSHHFDTTKAVLALPMTAPWGTVARAAELGQALQPKYIIPIHDWHYRDEARLGIYDRLEAFFVKQNIKFIKPVDAQPQEINV
ncbi:MAG: MBL fold metallo-hydrolase [Candidatus Saccharimonadales bacterium]